MANEINKRITKVAEEAAKIKKDYPELTYQQAIGKAKEIYKEKNSIAQYEEMRIDGGM